MPTILMEEAGHEGKQKHLGRFHFTNAKVGERMSEVSEDLRMCIDRHKDSGTVFFPSPLF